MTVPATISAMRRRTPPSERPKLTLVDGDLPDEEAERRRARRRHPTATQRDGGGFDGPEAV